MNDLDHLTTDYLVFRLANELYALPSSCVREVARYLPITPVPGTPPELPGIISRHGDVFPVVDPRPLLGLPQAEPTRASRILTASSADVELVLIADSVNDLVSLAATSFGPLPTTLDPLRARLLAGIASFEGQPLALLDIAALVAVVRDGG